MFVSVLSLVPLINLIALAVSFVDKSVVIFDLVALLYLSMLVLASVNQIQPPILILFVKVTPSAFKLETDKSCVILTLPAGFKSQSTILSSDVALDIYNLISL